MNAQIDSARAHPAVVAALVAAGLAVTACALVAIAYMLGWIPARAAQAGATASVATPATQVAGSAPDVALLPGETMVAAPDASLAKPVPPSSAVPPAPKEAAPQPAAPSKPLTETKPPARKPPPPIYAQPAPAPYAQPAPQPPPTATYAQVLPSRAAPAKPNYTRSEMQPPPTSYERSTRAICVNCGVIASVRAGDIDWEVRVRFDDGSAETLRYPDPPRVRVGERIHLEDGRLVPD